MYLGELEITAEKAVPLLAMADHYLITGLKSKLSSYISINVQRENAITMLKKALQFHAGILLASRPFILVPILISNPQTKSSPDASM